MYTLNGSVTCSIIVLFIINLSGFIYFILQNYWFKSLQLVKCFKSFSSTSRVFKKTDTIQHQKRISNCQKKSVFFCVLSMTEQVFSFCNQWDVIKWSKYWNKFISNLTGSYSSVVELHKLHYLSKAVIHMDSVFSHRTCQWILADRYMPHPIEEREIKNNYLL